MSALDTQVGGSHYKDMKIQPMEFSMANGLDACQHSIIKYVSRFRVKNGIADLEKAKHCIDLLIDFEKAKAESVSDSASDDGGDWIEWEGGENPVPSQNVEVRTRSGQTFTANSDTFVWHVYGLHFDIIAYRVIGESEEETAKPVGQDGEWIEWKGGVNPVIGKYVEVTLRSSETLECNSIDLVWCHYLTGSDIIAYRVIGDAK